jgi:AcrR family transcriptional regulator
VALFAAEGYERVTTRALAHRAGLSQTGLYIYFETKADILRAIGEATHEAMTTAFDAAAAQGGPPREALRRLLCAYVDYGLAHPAEYQLTFTVGPETLGPIEKDFTRPADRQGAGAKSFLRFRDHLAAIATPEMLNGFDPLTATQILWFAGHGAVTLLISRPTFPWTDRDALLAGLERVLLDGLLRGP